MFVSVSFCISLCMFTILNTSFMSKASATVCCEGLGLLKPFYDLVADVVQSSVS